MPSTILLAHRYPLVREGLKAVFERMRSRKPEQESDIWTFVQELGKAGKFDLSVLFLLTTLRKMRTIFFFPSELTRPIQQPQKSKQKTQLARV